MEWVWVVILGQYQLQCMWLCCPIKKLVHSQHALGSLYFALQPSVERGTNRKNPFLVTLLASFEKEGR